MNSLLLAGLAVIGLAVILGVAFLADRYGQRWTQPAPPPASPRADATREIAAIRASWPDLAERRIVPTPPYRLSTDTAPQVVVVAERGRHRAAA